MASSGPEVRSAGGELRLLPWSGPEGQPCYLDPDPDGGGVVSRLADQEEERQLADGTRLLRRAVAALREPTTTGPQVRELTARLCGALADVLRIAESRGGRLDP